MSIFESTLFSSFVISGFHRMTQIFWIFFPTGQPSQSCVTKKRNNIYILLLDSICRANVYPGCINVKPVSKKTMKYCRKNNRRHSSQWTPETPGCFIWSMLLDLRTFRLKIFLKNQFESYHGNQVQFFIYGSLCLLKHCHA